MSAACVCLFGEVLFDHFPDGSRVLGGAPFNVAWHLQAFAQTPCLISRVGNDAEGEAVRVAMREWGLRTDALQTDPLLATGRVSVQLREGEPHFDIDAHCAYDAIAAQALPACCLLYHGSLAIRRPESRRALARLRGEASGMVFFDANLRPPWWDAQLLQECLQQADWVKLNQSELELLSATTTPGTDQAAQFLSSYELKGLVVTRGAEGALVLTDDGARCEVAPTPHIEVVDTVGAGDGFAAVIMLGLINDWPLGISVERAQAFASALVGQRGATVRDPGFYRAFVNAWEL